MTPVQPGNYLSGDGDYDRRRQALLCAQVHPAGCLNQAWGAVRHDDSSRLVHPGARARLMPRCWKPEDVLHFDIEVA